VKKYGLYNILKPKERADDWAIILDESVEFGKHKLLVILGIRVSNIDFTRPLKLQDVTTLKMISKSKWSGEAVHFLLEDLKKEIGTIRYAVADYGNILTKGLRLSGITHVYDITHKIASILKSLYEKDIEFQKYNKALAKMRRSLCLSKNSHIVPPQQRVKARFMNLEIISDWGLSALEYLSVKQNSKNEEFIVLKWVKKFENLILELSTINNLISNIESKLKHNGLDENTLKDCNKMLERKDNDTNRIDEFKNSVEKYMNEIINKMPQEKKILCTSDIIESSFGKYKNYLSKNAMTGITNLSLCIPAFTGSLNNEEILKAMQNIKVEDIQEWTKINIGKSLITERREIFKKRKAG